MQPCATVSSPPVILEEGNCSGTTTIYANNTSAKVGVAAPRNWWNLSYGYRKKITVVNNAGVSLSSGYSVCLTLNTTSLVSSGKMLPSGNDLRIVYWNGSVWVEVDRDIIDMNTGSTQVWFKIQAAISANGSDSNYYIYYGNPNAGSPPANRSNVYDFWDDFDDASLDPAWTFSLIGGAAGSYSESGTVVILNATTSGDLWDTSDNFLFLSISRSYDVLVESYTSGWGGSHDTWSKMGGVQLRQSIDANSKNRIMSPVYSAVGATNSYRLLTAGSTFEQTTSTQPKYCRLIRIGETSRAWYSTNGILWTELGSQISFSGGLSDPVRLGIHLAGLSSSSHWVEVDWFKVRKYVDPEPSTSVGSEKSYSYYPTDYNILTGNYVSGNVPASVQVVDSNYFVVENPPLTTPTWWDSKYDYRRKVTVTEPNKLARTYEPVEVYLTFAQGSCFSKDTIRVAYWNGSSWSEIPSQVYNVTLWGDNTVRSATILWNVDVELNTSKDYYVYYDMDGEVTALNYIGLSTPSVVNRGTTFNLTTSYGTGDTIKITGTYYGTERNVTWINLKINPSYVAWDDWYISPGIFHLWVNGSDVFEGGAYTGEANTGPICEHSDESNYGRKGNAGSVTFEVVGPLLIRIKIVYPSQNPGYGGTIFGTFTDVFSIYYTPDSLTTWIKVEHKQEFPTAFTEATWGDWAHLDFPAWDVTPTQTNMAYRTSAGTYSEALTPNATGGTQHSDWTERWIEIFDNATVEPALGLFFMSDDRYTINTANYRIMNVGGQGSIWGIHWFPYWSVGSSVSGTYNYEFWWVAKKTNGTDPIRDEYIKAVNSLTTSIGSETPSPHKISTEFIFSGMTTNSPTQLNFTVVSHYNISNVNVTIQVWNYSSSAYVTSGEDYLTYISSGSNETKILSINVNPQFYASSGYAKIKVTGVNSTTTDFQQKINQIKLTYEYNASSTYDYVLKVVNQVTAAWNISLKVYDSSNIDRLLNATISFYDGASSDQIIVSNGNITQSEGPLYNLPEGVGSTVKISMSNLQASTSGTSYLYVYLKILSPGTSTYALYIITFEIT